MANKEIIEPMCMEARDRILKSKHETAPGIDGIRAEALQKVSPNLWRRIHSLIKNVWNKEEIRVEWKTGIVRSVCK